MKHEAIRPQSSEAGFLMTTLTCNWHHHLYKIRGGKRQIRESQNAIVSSSLIDPHKDIYI